MNHSNFVRIDQAVSARPLAVADKPRLSADHLSAIDPGLLESVKGILSDSRIFSSSRQVCHSSFTPRLSFSLPHHTRLQDPASFALGRRSNVPDLVFGQEQIRNVDRDDRSVPGVHHEVSKHATHSTGPDEQSPAVDPVKPDSVTGKPLDGWLPAPSGLKRWALTERVTGQNLPKALNEHKVKSTREDFPFKNFHQTGFDVKGRESEWEPRVQGYSVTDKALWLTPCSVNDSHGRRSEDQRLTHQNAGGTFTSNQMHGFPVDHSASSLATKPGHYSQVSEGGSTSTSVRQPCFNVAIPGSASNSMGHAESSAWRPAAVEYDSVARPVCQVQADASTSSVDSLLTGRLPFQTGNASYANSDVIVARRIVQDYKRIEFESFGQTVMVLKTTSDDLGVPSRDALDSKDNRRGENSFNSRNRSHEIISRVQSNSSEMSTYKPSSRESARDGDIQFSKRADLALKAKPVETRERSREKSVKKSEDRSRSKQSKAAADEFLRNKFLLEIGRREKELRRIAVDSGSSSISSFGLSLPHTATGTSHFEGDQERWPTKREETNEPSRDSIRMLEPRTPVTRYDSERSNSHSAKPPPDGVVSSRVQQEHPHPRDEVTADTRSSRSRRADEITSTEVEDFRRPLPPAKSGHRIIEPSVSQKVHDLTIENSVDVKREISGSQHYNRNTREPSTLSERRLNSSATRDSSATDGNQTSTSGRDKTNREHEVKDSFSKEGRVTYWENLKTKLGDTHSRKAFPVKSERQSSGDSRSKDSSQVKEARKTPRKENLKDCVKTENIPKRESAEEQSKFHVKTEHTAKRESTEDQNKFRVKTERNAHPTEERSSSKRKDSKETIKESVEITIRLPMKSKQMARPHPGHSLNRSQKVCDQHKAERNITSTQKMASVRSSATVDKLDLEQERKDSIPKRDEKSTADEKRNALKKKKNDASKNSHLPVPEANTSGARKSGSSFLDSTEQDDVVLRGDDKSDDLRNLLNSGSRDANWRKREIRREKDERSVILMYDTVSSNEEDELVIEVPGPRSRRAEDATSIGPGSKGRHGMESLDDRQRNGRRWRGVDDELDSELPRKRFKLTENVAERFARGGLTSRGRGRRTLRLQGDFQRRYSDAVDVDDYHHGTEDDAKLDHHLGHKDRYGIPDDKVYFRADDKSRISNFRNRYQGRSKDRYPTGGNTREQYPDEEPIVQRQEDDTEHYPGDTDERFQGNDSKKYCGDGMKKCYSGRRDEEQYPKRELDTEDRDDRFSDGYAQQHIRKRSSARYSNDNSEEHYRRSRSARYLSDDERKQYLSDRILDDAEEHFLAENSARFGDDFGEQYKGSSTDLHAGYAPKASRECFERPNARTITFDRLKEPRAFLKDLEQNCVDDYGEVERPCDIVRTVESDISEDDDDTVALCDVGCKELEGLTRTVDFEDSDDRRDSHEFYCGSVHDETAPLTPDEPLHTTGTRFGDSSRHSSFQTRPWRGRFIHRSMRGNRFQHRLGHRGGFGFQPQRKRFLPPPKKFMKRMAASEFFIQAGDNIAEEPSSIQEAMKQVISNIKEAEMADPEADAALFDTLSRGEKKQVIEIQQMTGIQCITAIVTALRTLWEFEPKVVRTLGNLEPEEIQQLGDDN